jgi:hypothetical protein
MGHQRNPTLWDRQEQIGFRKNALTPTPTQPACCDRPKNNPSWGAKTKNNVSLSPSFAILLVGRFVSDPYTSAKRLRFRKSRAARN